MDAENGMVDKNFNRQSQQSRYSDNVSMYQPSRQSHSQPPSYRSRGMPGEFLRMHFF